MTTNRPNVTITIDLDKDGLGEQLVRGCILQDIEMLRVVAGVGTPSVVDTDSPAEALIKVISPAPDTQVTVRFYVADPSVITIPEAATASVHEGAPSESESEDSGDKDSGKGTKGSKGKASS